MELILGYSATYSRTQTKSITYSEEKAERSCETQEQNFHVVNNN